MHVRDKKYPNTTVNLQAQL